MIRTLDLAEAQALFEQLPPRQRICTLSPAYATADAQRNDALESVFVCYREDAAFWLNSLHKAPVPNTGFFDLQSPYGYGGPVTNNEDRGFLARAWSAYGEWCQRNDILAEFVRFHPLLSNCRYYGGESLDDRSTVAIPLAPEDLMTGYQTRVRTAIRKASAAGMEAAWLDPADHMLRFADYYRQGMAEIGAADTYLFGDAYFAMLAKLPGVMLGVCAQGDAWLSAGVFLRGTDVLEYHLSATSAAGKRLGATNLLLHGAAKTARDNGLSWLYLGGGTDAREDNPLLFFKAGFSSYRFPFRIGFAIHRPQEYAHLRAEYSRAGGVSSRILFYR